MADFAEERQKLASAQAKAGATAEKLAEARIGLARLERERRAQARFAGDDAIQAFDQQISEEQARIASLKADLAGAKATLNDHLSSFVAFTDPRKQIGRLSDST